jgi:hypothetical protein
MKAGVKPFKVYFCFFNFQKGPSLKTSTAAVRTAYIECMSTCFHGNTLAQGVELIPLLLKTVERAVAQPAQVCFCISEHYSEFSVI